MVHDRSVTQELIETVVPELIRDALSQDTRIIDVYDFDISFKMMKPISHSEQIQFSVKLK